VAKQNLELFRATTYEMSYTHTASMTGGTVYYTVKTVEWDSDATDTTATIKKTITSFSSATVGGVTVAGAKASWTLTDTDMYIEPKTYFYSLIYEDASGKSLPPIFTGKFKVDPHTTNRNVGNEV
jgi:hypothetical protein